MLSSCVDVGTPTKCFDNEEATAKDYNMTEKCVTDVKTSLAKLNFENELGGICLWIMILYNLFKNKLIFNILKMVIMFAVIITVLCKLNALILYRFGCPVYVVSGVIQRLTMKGVTSCVLDSK